MPNAKFMAIFAVYTLILLPAAASAEDLQHGRRVFQLCTQCHVLDLERNGFGPYLKGVVGRPAGSVPGYRYSKAMTEAGADGLVWNEEALAEYLYSPKKKVAGTTMPFWGLWSQSEIKDVIAYLRANP